MFQRIAGFLRRLFTSKGFLRGVRIFLVVYAAMSLYSIIRYFIAVMNDGISFWEALRFLFTIPLTYPARIPFPASFAIGIVAGLIWYFNRKKKSRESTEADEKEEEASNAAGEEEFIEPTHYKYH